MSFEIYHDGTKVMSLDEEVRYIKRALTDLELDKKELLEEIQDINLACGELRQRLQEIAEKGAANTMQEPD